MSRCSIFFDEGCRIKIPHSLTIAIISKKKHICNSFWNIFFIFFRNYPWLRQINCDFYSLKIWLSRLFFEKLWKSRLISFFLHTLLFDISNSRLKKKIVKIQYPSPTFKIKYREKKVIRQSDKNEKISIIFIRTPSFE